MLIFANYIDQDQMPQYEQMSDLATKQKFLQKKGTHDFVQLKDGGIQFGTNSEGCSVLPVWHGHIRGKPENSTKVYTAKKALFAGCRYK